MPDLYDLWYKFDMDYRPRMLSQARTDLFGIFEDVTKHPGRKVVLRHRGSDAEAVVVSRDYLARLERGAACAVDSTFSLFGSAVIHGSVDEVLREVRRDAEAGLEKKLANLSSGKKKG